MGRFARSAAALAVLVLVFPAWNAAARLPVITGLDRVKLTAHVRHLLQALDARAALTPAERQAIEQAFVDPDGENAVQRIQEVLDAHCLVVIAINPESRVRVARGPAAADLDQKRWHTLLVKIHNQGGVTAPLAVRSPNAQAADRPSTREQWCDLRAFASPSLPLALSGSPLEYRLIQIYSREAGAREARLAFDVGQGTQDLGFRSEVDILFKIRPEIPLNPWSSR